MARARKVPVLGPLHPSAVVVRTKQDGFYYVAGTHSSVLDIIAAARAADVFAVFDNAGPEGITVAIWHDQITAVVDVRTMG